MEKIISPWVSVLFVLLMPSFVLSCYKMPVQKNQPGGVYHLVKKNETVQMIAGAYNIPTQNLLKTNKIKDAGSITEGSVLFIPKADKVIEIKTAKVDETIASDMKQGKYEDTHDINKSDVNKTISEETDRVNKQSGSLPEKQYSQIKQTQKKDGEEAATSNAVKKKSMAGGKNESLSQATKKEEKIIIDKKKFIWPVQGKVRTQFGIQSNKTYHNWIKIVAKAGTKVKAAASGTVIFSSSLKNYGETIIIRHKDSYATVYTHLKKRYVKIDQNVKKGETIALVGEKDDAGETYMNFEIRLKGKARNPVLFLP